MLKGTSAFSLNTQQESLRKEESYPTSPLKKPLELPKESCPIDFRHTGSEPSKRRTSRPGVFVMNLWEYILSHSRGRKITTVSI